MSALDQINAYVVRLEARFRLLLWLRGLALSAAAALAITILLALILRLFGFVSPALVSGRVLLYLGVALVLTFALAFPLLRLNRRWAAQRAERDCPQLQERLLTLVEKQGEPSPLTELLAADALEAVRGEEPQKLIPARWIAGLATTAGAAAAILLWLVFAGPGFLGYGSAVLWGNTPRADLYPARTILVRPGNLSMRRKAGQQITAQLIGFSAPSVRLFARYRNAQKWDAIPMQSEAGTDRYQFLIAGLDDTLDYYVEAGSVRSKTYTLTARSLPNIQSFKVTYHFPPALGLKDAVEDPGGDLRAVQGTVAELSIQADRPLPEGAIVLDNGSRIAIEAGQSPNSFTARVPILKDGSYYIGASEAGENLRLSDDFFIEAKPDAPPTVKIVWPGHDSQVSPVEEMSIKLEAEDDYGLKEASIHYSVNGGPERTLSLLPSAPTKKVAGKTTLAMEDFKLIPGDVVSYYATARDAKSSVKSDIFFAAAQPFDFRYSQAQAGGSQGQGSDDADDQFSGKQKEIIAATWNEIKNPKPETSAAEAKFLSDMQSKLGDQARSLAQRMRARGIDTSSPEFQVFTKYIDLAATTMKSAADQLRPAKWQDALPVEQKALQYALRAEAAFRDIRVAFGNNVQGSGGGNDARALERLLDLELDTDKNQYETEQTGSKSSEEAKKLDEALRKLKELAKRQQELAAQQPKADQQFRQRWEQEMLRREAEELRKQMEDMQRQQSSRSSQQASSQGSQRKSGSSQESQQSEPQSGEQQPGQQQSGQQQSAQQAGQPQQGQPSSASGSAGRPGNMSGESSAQLDRALRQIEQAEQQMRAGNSGDPDASRRASQNLQEAGQSIENARRLRASQEFNDMQQRAGRLAESHKALMDSMRREFAGGKQEQDSRFGPTPGRSSSNSKRLGDQEERLASELRSLHQQMSDTAGRLSEGQPEASSKLRQALGELDEKDLETRMRTGAEWLRKGQGMYTWMREGVTAEGLEKLHEQLREAGQALRKDGDENGKQAAGAKDGTSKQMESALSQVQELRKGLQQLREGQGENAGAVQQEAQRALGRLRGAIQDQMDPTLNSDFNEVSSGIRQLAGGDPRELKERLNRDVLPGLERIEMELRRKLDARLAENIRTATPERAPEGYADAVAEYYRRLSKTK